MNELELKRKQTYFSPENTLDRVDLTIHPPIHLFLMFNRFQLFKVPQISNNTEGLSISSLIKKEKFF